MIVTSLKLVIHLPWAQSLKEKRSEIKSLTSRARRQFNISISEVASQDVYKTAVLGVVFVTTDQIHADSIVDNVINYIESNTEGEIIKVERE